MKQRIFADNKTGPHFSLTRAATTGNGAIPPYKGAKQLLYDMFHQIAQTHYNYRESWEILIEVLGLHLGIVDHPWIYSDPSREMEKQIDRASPIKRPAFWVERPKLDKFAMLAVLLGIPMKQPTIKITQPTGPYNLSREIYYEHRYKTVRKQHPMLSSHRRHNAERFLEKFEQKGLLQQYVENARTENPDPASPGGYNGIDHLGAIFEEFELAGRANRLGQCLTPMNVVDFICQSTIGDKTQEKPRPLTVMDPALGTGRFLMEASRLNWHRPLILFGIELDVTLYRAALVNMAIYNRHPYAILCGDTLMLDVQNHPEVWNLANLWEPADISKYYWKAPPKFKFSLANMAAKSKEEPIREAISAIAPPEVPTIPQRFSLSAMAKQKQKH